MQCTFVKLKYFRHCQSFIGYHYGNRLFSLNLNSNKIENFLLKSNLLENHNFINGKRINGLGLKFDNRNPATGKILAKINSCSNDQIDECIKSSITAQSEWISKYSNIDKHKILINVANIVRSKAKILASVDVLDTGKAMWEAENDIYTCADVIEMFAAFLYSFEGSHVPLHNDNFYYTRREPLGVCVGIGAWNFPFQIMSWKSAPAIAAGNSFVFKPSPLTPLSAILLAEIYKDAGIPEGLVSVVQGGAEVGNYLSSHPDVAKISFTGSVDTGRKIMNFGSNTLKQLTLELGGKSPLIIFDDTDMIEAVKGTLLANFLTQGEVCSNGTRVYIQSKIYSEFETQLVKAVQTLKIGDPFDPSISIGAIISEDQYNTIMGFINSAKDDGAKVLYGGTPIIFSEDSPLSGGKFIKPCVISKCTDTMKVVKEEIFGPVACLMPFESESEVIARANESTLGLAGGVFTKDINRAHRIASRLKCGNVYINTYNAYPIGMPFGGYKQSGFGRENCKQTLEYYSQVKSVFVESNPIDYPFWPMKK